VVPFSALWTYPLVAAALGGTGSPSFDVESPSRAEGATTARIVLSTPARRTLASRRVWRRVHGLTAWSGQAQTLLVLDGAERAGREWVKVLLPERPNGAAGWIRRDHVVLGHTPYWVHVRIAARVVTVFRRGVRVRQFRAVVGAPGTPTPLGLAAVWERNRQPAPWSASLGPWALSLTSLSDALFEYDGGPGRIAIHGRAGALLRDPLGTSRSLGCVRVTNRAVSWMARRLPVGTPVRVTS
jgi:L,D-transpeptidase catalytic domain